MDAGHRTRSYLSPLCDAFALSAVGTIRHAWELAQLWAPAAPAGRHNLQDYLFQFSDKWLKSICLHPRRLKSQRRSPPTPRLRKLILFQAELFNLLEQRINRIRPTIFAILVTRRKFLRMNPYAENCRLDTALENLRIEGLTPASVSLPIGFNVSCPACVIHRRNYPCPERRRLRNESGTSAFLFSQTESPP